MTAGQAIHTNATNAITSKTRLAGLTPDDAISRETRLDSGNRRRVVGSTHPLSFDMIPTAAILVPA